VVWLSKGKSQVEATSYFNNLIDSCQDIDVRPSHRCGLCAHQSFLDRPKRALLEATRPNHTRTPHSAHLSST
jgi:hypothetical protein